MSCRYNVALCGVLASLALGGGTAARADVLLNYAFDAGSIFDVGCCNYNALGSFTYDATTSTISNVTYNAQPGGYVFTAATVNSPTDVTFTGDCCGDQDEFFFAHSLALGGTDAITGGAFPSDVTLAVSASGSVTSAVPEPAAWALMLVGFGGVGAAIRGRRTAIAANT